MGVADAFVNDPTDLSIHRWGTARRANSTTRRCRSRERPFVCPAFPVSVPVGRRAYASRLKIMPLLKKDTTRWS
jgi:hypothetical protein